MNSHKIVGLLLCFILLTQSIFAFETDQYNLPPQPLADIGGEVSAYVGSVVQKSVTKVNTEILIHQNCLVHPVNQCEEPDKNRQRLAYLRSNDAVAREVYNILGAGIIPFTKSGSWMESHDFAKEPARYKVNYRHSIFLFLPTSYFGLASTVNMYDSQFGTDKIAHLFQEGYQYFKIYNDALNKGSTTAQATEKAIKWGRKSEKSFYGTWVSGVYSNADLFANYVGLKFYQGLTQEIRLGKVTRPPVLQIKDGIWTINEDFDMPNMLIKPFISSHLNEALNPSVFTRMFGLRAYVRRVVKKQACQEWLSLFPNLSPVKLDSKSKELMLWNGEDYGFTNSNNFVTIANTCFSNEYMSKTTNTSDN